MHIFLFLVVLVTVVAKTPPILTVLKAKGHSADMGAGKFPLVSMGGRAEGLACADPGARTPIGASGNCLPSANKLRTSVVFQNIKFNFHFA